MTRVKGFQVDVGIEELNNVNTAGSPTPINGDILVFNSGTGSWEHQQPSTPGGVATSYSIDITTGTGSPVGITETTLPPGWSTSYNTVGDFVIIHGLGSTQIGYALSVVWNGGSRILNPASIAAGSTNFRIEDATGTPVEGRIVGMMFK